MAHIDAFLKLAKESGASDFHIAAGSPPMLRINGALKKVKYKELAPNETYRLLFEILSEEQRKIFNEKHDMDFSYEVAGLGRFRGNALLQRKGIDAVFRIIPDNISTFEELGIPEIVRSLTRLNKGLVLVTGPAGCGKSTTLTTLIDTINGERKEHILTLEDPIEFVHPKKKSLVNQRQIGQNSESFASALRAALREDPDVILIGEMRDLETISMAITAAETGHLVFGTLHTRTAASTVDRIINSFPATQQAQIRTMLAESIQGVVTQQLLNKADGSGRVATFEVLMGSAPLANLIRDGKTFQIPSLIQTGKSLGMQTMDSSILAMVKSGVISPQVGYEKGEEKKLFKSLLQNSPSA